MAKDIREKNYKASVKIIAVILPIIFFISLIAEAETIGDIKQRTEYREYYACEITDASAEKQEDGSYIVTVTVKNNSAYQTRIDRNSIQAVYGNSTWLDNRYNAYAESSLLESVNRPLVPAGRSVEYKLQIMPPEGITTVRLQYYGVSYSRYELTGEDRESDFTLKL